MSDPPVLRGIAAMYATPDGLLSAVRSVRDDGYTRVETYTPFPIEEVPAALGFRDRWLPWIAVAGFVLAAGGGYLMQWWVNVVHYPLNVGGRPLAAWPAFTVPAFEMGMAGCAVACVVAMLWRNGLPDLNAPVFSLPNYWRASDSRFLLIVDSSDRHFDPVGTRALLEETGATHVEELRP